MSSSNDAVQRSIEAVWRVEAARLIGGLVRLTRNLDQAEDLAQQALLSALETWPQSGIPKNPGAWLMAAAKHRGIDWLRRQRLLDRKHEELGRHLAVEEPSFVAAVAEEPVGDDVLRLMLAACHPVLSKEARVALTLRLLGGLTTEEIARASLSSEPTIAQRIVRAKRTLSEARVPFSVPEGVELTERTGPVLEVIYLIFNEGYSSTRGDHWARPALCDEALRLGRILVALVPLDAEAWGLLALMELQGSRLRARTNRSGQVVTLFEQNRATWDPLMISRGLTALEQADRVAGTRGPYTLQAAIAACHARARSVEQTDWTRIVALYDGLLEVTQSPVVALNRAVAVAMAFGPEAGLELLDELEDEPALAAYHHLPSVRGDFLFRLGRVREAGAQFERAVELTQNQPERAHLLARIEACRDQAAQGPASASSTDTDPPTTTPDGFG